MAALAFPLPPANEQGEIVRSVEAQISSLEKAAEDSDSLTLRSVRLRQAILKRAFEGKLVPQDPKDEPAEELLARIRKAREEGAAGEVQRRTERRGSRRPATRQRMRQDA